MLKINEKLSFFWWIKDNILYTAKNNFVQWEENYFIFPFSKMDFLFEQINREGYTAKTAMLKITPYGYVLIFENTDGCELWY